ncbi:MAG: hypothetical protein IPN49_16640 [Saprospiraceae bacterium]|nr:hypothetical protein [Saprospiraceae bacterium]
MLLMLMMVVCGATLSAQLGPEKYFGKEFLGLNGKIEFNQSKLVLESDGNIRVYCKGTEKWSSNTGGSGGNVLRMQNDGNLVLYKNNSSQSHDAVWSSGTYEIFGTNAEKLRFKYLGFEVFSEELCIFASKSCFGPNANPNANGTAMWSLFHNGQWAANGSNGFKTNNKLPWVTGPSYEYTTKDLVSPRQLPLGSSSTYEFTKGSVMRELLLRQWTRCFFVV